MIRTADDPTDRDPHVETDGVAGVLLLKADDAADRLAISVSQLAELSRRGDVPAVRIGRSVRYDPRDLDGNEGPLLKPEAAAAALAISPRKLWALTSTEEIPCVRLGSAVRYRRCDLLAWIDERKEA